MQLINSMNKKKFQTIRVWYNYLQTCLKHNMQVNKDYYAPWHLSQVKKQRFDVWYKRHSHLFGEMSGEVREVKTKSELNYNNINLEIPTHIDYADAIAQVRSALKYRLGKTQFSITNKRFRYLEVDDYLKCWKQRYEQKKTYTDIGYKIYDTYKKKLPTYAKSTKMKMRKFTKTPPEKYKNEDDFLRTVKRKVEKADKILVNTAKGEFTGKY